MLIESLKWFITVTILFFEFFSKKNTLSLSPFFLFFPFKTPFRFHHLPETFPEVRSPSRVFSFSNSF